MIKKLLRATLSRIGYELVNKNYQLNKKFTMEASLQRCLKRGIHVNTVIDVGASNGMWSKMCLNHFDQAKYLLIEAQQPHEKDLAAFKSQNSKIDYVLAAAGPRKGKIFFDTSSLLGGVASDTPLNENFVEVPVTTIDDEVRNRGLKPPFLIKLDTHGFEVPILEGALETLKNASLVIIETYNFKLREGSLRYHEMVAYMEKLGFSSIEIADLLLRSKDKSLWQMDTFFIRSDAKEFESVSFN